MQTVSRLTLALVVLTLVALIPTRAEAAETAEGKIKQVNAQRLVITDKDDKDHTFAIANGAKITLNGEQVRPNQLKAGQDVKVTYTKENDTLLASEIAARTNNN